jgi:hypothetical protein
VLIDERHDVGREQIRQLRDLVGRDIVRGRGGHVGPPDARDVADAGLW